MRKLYLWIPSLYILQGLPFALVSTVSLILYKQLNIPNTQIALWTSLFTLPWFIKPLIAPIFESFTKRMLIIFTSTLLAFLILLLSISLGRDFFLLSIIIFFAIAFESSLYDTTSDGFYLTQLNPSQQAHFIGIRTLSYHVGRLIAQGLLVLLASILFQYVEVKEAWQIAFILLAISVFFVTTYHAFVLPHEKRDTHSSLLNKNVWRNFKQVYRELIALPYVLHAVIFVLIYNLSENQLIKIVPLFLMDNIHHGGLQLNTAQIGFLIGIIGTISMLGGVLVSGFLSSKTALSQYLLPITILSCVMNVGYLLLSITMTQSNYIITIIIILTQFTFGLSNGAYLLYLLNCFGKGPFSMSLYAIGTAIMGFGVTIGGAISGYLQFLLGYSGFFSWIMLCSIVIIFYCYYLVKKGYCYS